MPSQASPSARPADRARPVHSPVVTPCAAAGGPTISVKTSSTPTICAHSETASATTARNAVETNRSGTPFASVNPRGPETHTSTPRRAANGAAVATEEEGDGGHARRPGSATTTARDDAV